MSICSKLAPLVDAWTTSADVDHTKPNPELIEAAAQIGSRSTPARNDRRLGMGLLGRRPRRDPDTRGALGRHLGHPNCASPGHAAFIATQPNSRPSSRLRSNQE